MASKLTPREERAEALARIAADELSQVNRERKESDVNVVDRTAQTPKDTVAEKAKTAKDATVDKAKQAKDTTMEKAGEYKDYTAGKAVEGKDTTVGKMTELKDSAADTARRAMDYLTGKKDETKTQAVETGGKVKQKTGETMGAAHQEKYEETKEDAKRKMEEMNIEGEKSEAGGRGSDEGRVSELEVVEYVGV